MPELRRRVFAPFLPREERNRLVDEAVRFYIIDVEGRAGTDLKGNPQKEWVYTLKVDGKEGPVSISLVETTFRTTQVEKDILPGLSEGAVGPCVLKLCRTYDGAQTFYAIEPAGETAA